MNSDERLTENVRVRLSLGEKVELEAAAALEDRSASALGRRAIRRELERLRARKAPKPSTDAA